MMVLMRGRRLTLNPIWSGPATRTSSGSPGIVPPRAVASSPSAASSPVTTRSTAANSLVPAAKRMSSSALVSSPETVLRSIHEVRLVHFQN